jgi:hypothetical protein
MPSPGVATAWQHGEMATTEQNAGEQRRGGETRPQTLKAATSVQRHQDSDTSGLSQKY